MLVLTRKEGEQVWIGSNIQVSVVKISRGRVRLGFVAPSDVTIDRPDSRRKVEMADPRPDSRGDGSRKRHLTSPRTAGALVAHLGSPRIQHYRSDVWFGLGPMKWMRRA